MVMRAVTNETASPAFADSLSKALFGHPVRFVNMTRRFLALFLLTVATAIPHLHPRAAKYEGFKVYRVATGDQLQDISKKMTGLKYEQWNRDIAHHMDFSLDADDAKRFTKLGLKFRELHENLGAAIALEGAWEPWQGERPKLLDIRNMLMATKASKTLKGSPTHRGSILITTTKIIYSSLKS